MTTDERTIGIVGTGDIGAVIARLSAAAGLTVHISNSRGPETLQDLAAELGPNTQASTVGDTIDASDLVVVAIPFGRFEELPAERLQGKILVDATNYIPFRDTGIDARLASVAATSELLQQHFTGTDVVKAFNNIYSGHLQTLARPTGATDRSALPIAGDNDDAKEAVTRFLDQIGWDAVDAGSLAQSARFSVGQPVFVRPYLLDTSGTDEQWGARMTHDPGNPLNREEVAQLLAAH